MSWHLTVISIFVVGTTVFLVSNWDETGGWWYTIILLLGLTLVWENGKANFGKFADQLYAFGFPKP
jgi:hypothetical protein